MQQNWAVGIGVFDEIPFQTYYEASIALKRNGFSKFKEDKNAQEFIGLPEGEFMESRHPNARIYSSERFWW